MLIANCILPGLSAFAVIFLLKLTACEIRDDKKLPDVGIPDVHHHDHSPLHHNDALRGLQSIDARHPLEPLNCFEVRVVAYLVRVYNNTCNWHFKFIGLREPDKTAMYPYFLTQTNPPHGHIPRRANVLITDPKFRIPIWVVVNLSSVQVESWVESTGEQLPTESSEDSALAAKIAFSDPHIVDRIKSLGYKTSEVVSDIWDAGYVPNNPTYAQPTKMVQLYFYGMRTNGTNYYAHPLDFLAVVELGSNRVRRVENLEGTPRATPLEDHNYLPEQLPRDYTRHEVHPLRISQPQGPTFNISGREVSWHNFKLRVGFNSREGAHIYTVTYNDSGEIRPVAYRLSLSEIYLQSNNPQLPSSSFMMGSWGLGSSSRSLPVHQFCRGDAHYFPTDHYNEEAETWRLQNSICVVEEDAGLLWAHFNPVSDRMAATRNQRLSISSLVSIQNTDYWISWRFYEDATIELGIKITGIPHVNLVPLDVKAPPYGNLVAEQLHTPIFQHFFAVRLDLDVDGENNTVSVEDIIRMSEHVSSANPYGNGAMINRTVLKTAGDAVSDARPARSWKIANPHNIQYLSGLPVAWKLIPQGPYKDGPNLLTPDSPLRNRVPWTNYSMWVLPYNGEQIFAGGKYLSDGVATWTQQNLSADIEDADVVLWHVFNYVHLPDIEDWPVVSQCPGTTGFRLRPSGFFNENHALSAPPARETSLLDGKDNPNRVSIPSSDSIWFPNSGNRVQNQNYNV